MGPPVERLDEDSEPHTSLRSTRAEGPAHMLGSRHAGTMRWWIWVAVGSCTTQPGKLQRAGHLARPRLHGVGETEPFVPTGSAADLCKMAMIHIFAAVATSPTLTARSVSEWPVPGPAERVHDPSRARWGRPAALWRARMRTAQAPAPVGLGHGSTRAPPLRPRDSLESALLSTLLTGPCA